MALPHCVPAAHSLLWKALLLGPSLIDSACSPHRLCRVIITSPCGHEKAASICTKQDSYGPVSLGMREDLWNKKNNPPPPKKKQYLPDSDPITGLFSILPLVFFESCWPASSLLTSCCFQGASTISSCLSHGPVQFHLFRHQEDFLTLGLWRLSLVLLDWRWLLFCSPKVPSEVRGGCPSAHSLIHSTNIFAPSRGWKFKRI